MTTERRDIYDVLDDLERTHGATFRAMSNDPNLAHRTRVWLVDKYRKDPLVQQYLAVSRMSAAVTGGRGAALTEPWMALAEQRCAILILAALDTRVTVHGASAADASNTLHRAHIATLLSVSQTYLWTRDVFNVIKACPLPPHVVSRELLPFPFSYHTLEVAYDLHPASPVGRPGDFQFLETGQWECDWLHLASVPNASHCDLVQNACPASDDAGERREAGYHVCCASLRLNARYPDDYPPHVRHAASQVLAMLAFLRSPYTVVEAQKVPRQWRRGKAAAASPETATSVINVVQLRTAAREAVAAYEAESRSFKHRWWVAGHFRSQWHPSTRSHEVIWIAPHLKGPSDAPMLEKVYAVTR